MRILIAEDDKAVGQAVAWALQHVGHEPLHVRDGAAAEAAVAHQAFDLVILDLGLPGVSGLDLLRHLRERGVTVPVLVLSASAGVDSRVRSLDLGADDYMIKPFAVAELEARVRALARRERRPAGEIVRRGSLAVDVTGHTAWIDGRKIDLSARELSLLELLLRSHGRLVTKNQLVEHLLGFGSEVGRNAIEVYIHRIRRKIESAAVRITTIPGMGYCLEMDRLEHHAQ
jgi:two-component system OmpR family response regulator